MPGHDLKHADVPKDFAFKPGQCFRRGVTVIRLVAELPAHYVLEHVTSLERRYVLKIDIYRDTLKGVLIPCTENDAARSASGHAFVEDDEPVVVRDAISMLSPATQSAGRKNIKYIRALRELGYTSLRPTPLLQLDYERLRRTFGDTEAPRLSTIYRWSLLVDGQNGDWRAAFPNYADRGGGGKTRIAPEALAVLEKVFNELQKARKARIRFSAIEADFKGALKNMGEANGRIIQIPARSTIERLTKAEFGAYEICRRNHGEKAADEKFRSWYPRDRATTPLETVEFDDKDTRVFGIDDRTGLPAGRIYLTSGVDQNTCVPLGFSISDRYRNTWSAINAFANSVLPKDLTLPEWSQVASDVPYFGKMAISVFDNALYNHAADLDAATLEIANHIAAFAKPLTPTEKSVVEDFNGHMVTDFLPTLPGFAGEKNSRDRLKEGLAAANLSVADFRQRFLKWTYDVYCNAPREGGLTPRQRWELGMQGRDARVPADINKIRMALTLRNTLRLRPEGILFTHLIYQNQRLLTMRRRLGSNAYVDIRYHPEKLNQIYINDPLASQWFLVPSVNPEYTTHLTFAQHKLVVKLAKSNGVKNPSIPELLYFRETLATLVEQGRKSTKLKERKFANLASGPDFPFNKDRTATVTQAVTYLEDQVAQIESVEMETGDEGWDCPDLG